MSEITAVPGPIPAATPAASSAPDQADLFEALGILGDALSTGMRLDRPPAELLGRPRLAAAAAAPRPEPAIAPAREAAAAAEGEGDALAVLRSRALSCSACGLSATRRSVVFGQGVAGPVVLVVGEGPGAEEDAQGLPFVGASGKLLDRMLHSIGLSREENCYIANIVKCRPPNNREPAPDERVSCMPYLREQIDILKPRAILCAGRTAAQTLLATTEGINRLRVRTHEYQGIPLVATYHPSALLRDETLKRPAWEDLKRLRDIVSSGSAAHE